MRYLIPIVVLLAVVGGLGFIKFKQFSSLSQAMEAGQKAGPPPEVVGTAVTREESWEGTISAVGTVAAVRGVAGGSGGPGGGKAIPFEAGHLGAAGPGLAGLATAVESAQP